MKNNEFRIDGTYCVSTYGGYELEVSRDGSCARVRSDFDGKVSKNPRWQEIKYTKNGEPFVTFYGKRMKLDNFIR